MASAPLFGTAHRLLIGVVHLVPTPGSPRGMPMAALLARARTDARALSSGGCHALIVENFGDAPFHKERVPAETVAALALALDAVRDAAGELPVGVNVLRNDARAALGLCAATGAAFLRVNVHTGAMLTDQGIVEGRAAETLRERVRLCPRAAILADVHVKHAAVLGAETLEDAAADAWERGGADALIVSGRGTGRAPDVERIARVRRAVPRARILVGSGLDASNAAALLEHADGAIVGSAFERGAKAGAPVDARRVARIAALFART
jgi:membrane complex biogenesis BtpA family protein